MEQTIRVVTDSSSDLPPDLARELEIEIVPLSVHFGTDVYPDSELTAEEFWQKASVGAYTEVFEPLVASGNQVLCVALTSKHSGTYNSALLAAQRFSGAVTVFDSESLSLGLGLQAVAAARHAQAGHAMHRAGHAGEPSIRRSC